MKILSTLKILQYSPHKTCAELMFNPYKEVNFKKYGHFENGKVTKEWADFGQGLTEKFNVTGYSYIRFARLWDSYFANRPHTF